MNWAWEQRLEPSTKIVLLALADIADDQGMCWPSIPTLSRKVCASERTVQRIVHRLGRDTDGHPALIRIVARSRENGSRSSNVYLLQMPGDNLSPGDIAAHPGDSDDGGTVTQLRQGGGDKTVTRTGDRAMSPLEPPAEPPPQPKRRTTSRRAVDKQLSAETQRQLVRELSRLAISKQPELAAQLADGMREGTIRSPVAWTRAAVDRIVKAEA